MLQRGGPNLDLNLIIKWNCIWLYNLYKLSMSRANKYKRWLNSFDLDVRCVSCKQQAQKSDWEMFCSDLLKLHHTLAGCFFASEYSNVSNMSCYCAISLELQDTSVKRSRLSPHSNFFDENLSRAYHNNSIV